MSEINIPKTNCILIDYFSFTSKLHSVEDIQRLLELKGVKWVEGKGQHGYRDAWFCEHIKIHYNGREDMGVWCEMTGQGCRAYETYGKGDFEGLIRLIIENESNMNLTRLDIAFDDHEGILSLEKMAEHAHKLYFVSYFTDGYPEIPFNREKGITIYHGSKKSDIFIRIYDKAKERGYENGIHWVRVEIQMRDNRALEFARGILSHEYDIGYMFCGVLNNYLRYVKPCADSNKRRWETRSYWKKLLAHAERIKLCTNLGVEYNRSNLNNSINQNAGAIYTQMRLNGILGLKSEVEDTIKDRGLNPKYQKLIDEYAEKKPENNLFAG